MKIRKIETKDCAQIAEIYNFYITNTHHTFETEPVDCAEMQKRIDKTIEEYPFLICEKNTQILGYAYAARYKSRPAYRRSVEVSVYVKNSESGRGIGARLYRELLDEISETDAHAVVAGIALPNQASIRLHEKFGFEKVAHFREVGFKLGRWIDVGYWELIK